ncbi:MAG: DUF1460 domain-containing protein [Ignavibacteriae bacterium]|nr:DUF1460 domain-containing protein [Ignavibacteria bacterium]MBI3364059.1 DUF1460 domain-containing protein [Ignavibacteriota bacterium]
MIKHHAKSLTDVLHLLIESSTLQSKIQSGDLIAITTSQEGLDISHTGIAVRLDNGSLHLLHASDVENNVEITAESLTRYLKKHEHQTGITVLRVAGDIIHRQQ